MIEFNGHNKHELGRAITNFGISEDEVEFYVVFTCTRKESQKMVERVSWDDVTIKFVANHEDEDCFTLKGEVFSSNKHELFDFIWALTGVDFEYTNMGTRIAV